MCDTLVVTGEAAAHGRTIFAKNSDREPDEAQLVELVPGADHPADARAYCSYLDIPQAPRTHRTLLCRPYWMWGAEMGLNEHGVAIGNQAVFTHAPSQPVGLLGMDLLRLGLERATSAHAAVDVIVELLSEHGQGGPAGHHDKSFRYDSSFIIADSEQAWVLETAGRMWAAKRVHGVRSISNALSLRDDWDRAADGLAAAARDMGRSPGRGKVDFARTFGKAWMGHAAGAASRRACVEGRLRSAPGGVEWEDVLAALRQHGSPDRPGRALRSLRGSVCGHAAPWPTRAASQTTGSLVVEMRPLPVAYVTGTSAACLSVFRPLWLEQAEDARAPSARYDAGTLWWAHERLHRLALCQIGGALDRMGKEREGIEARLRSAAVRAESASQRAQVQAEGFREAFAFSQRWERRLRGGGRLPLPLRDYFRRLDRRSGLEAALSVTGFRY